MTCRPPPGTKPGTLCILTRGEERCVGRWDAVAWVFRRPNQDVPHGTFLDTHIPRDGGCRCGWVFAGVMPETARPQTAQEIAREALDKVRGVQGTPAAIIDITDALIRIRDMPEEA